MVKRIIDKRIKEKFMMDDAYLNGQAKICGWQATLVYNSLCRHVNIDQESFPSIGLMSEELGVSRDTVMKGIENLAKFNVIKIKRNRTKNGKWLNNTYTLMDKLGWIKSQVAVADLDSPSGCGRLGIVAVADLDQVGVADTKETHRSKETHVRKHMAVSGIGNQMVSTSKSQSLKMTEADFDLFWQAYPNKKKKPKALEIFLRLNKAELLKIIEAVEAQKKTSQWTEDGGRFIPHPTTWLNQGRWEDQEPEVAIDLDKQIRADVKEFGDQAQWSGNKGKGYDLETIKKYSNLFWSLSF
jgi:hypothetical protein